MNKQFPKEDIQVTNSTKRCPTSLIIREMQIKITVWYHFTSVRMAIKKTRDNKCCRECEEKRIRVYCWWECKLVEPLMEKQYGQFSKIKNVKLPHNPAISLLGIYLKELKSVFHRDMYNTVVFAASFAFANWNQCVCSLKQINKNDSRYICTVEYC